MCRQKTVWGSGLAIAASGVQVCWEASGFLISDHPVLRQEEWRAAELQLESIPPEPEWEHTWTGMRAYLPSLVPEGRVSAFHVILCWFTVFWECPSNFKMTFLCGLLFLICYHLTLHLYLTKPRTRWNTFWSGIQTVTI